MIHLKCMCVFHIGLEARGRLTSLAVQNLVKGSKASRPLGSSLETQSLRCIPGPTGSECQVLGMHPKI